MNKITEKFVFILLGIFAIVVVSSIFSTMVLLAKVFLIVFLIGLLIAIISHIVKDR